jgi:hypothetical protein
MLLEAIGSSKTAVIEGPGREPPALSARAVAR